MSTDRAAAGATVRVGHERARRFVHDLLVAAGVDAREADIVATVLLWTQTVGRATQALWRLPIYIERLRRGLIRSPCRPTFEERARGVHVLHGGDGLGQYLGCIAMERAIELARRNGVGVTAVHASNHFGAAAYYVQMAAEQATLGLAFANSVPRVAAPGAKSPSLGTNPLAFGAPLRNGQSILADLSTGASSGSALRKAAEDEVPVAAAVWVEGGERAGAHYAPMRGFGGAKGFCLGLMVEVLAGVVTGAAVSHQIASLYRDFERSQDVGHLFVAIDIGALMPLDRYYDRMDTLVAFVRESVLDEACDEILLPGELRWRNRERQLRDGVEVDVGTVEHVGRLADELGVAQPW